MPNAIALNSTQFNLARVIGPLLAGVALATLGSAACFALNGVSFLFVIASLLMLHIRHVAGHADAEHRARDAPGACRSSVTIPSS